MDCAETKLTFLRLEGTSASERAFLERVLAPGHSKVQLPADTLPAQRVDVVKVAGIQPADHDIDVADRPPAADPAARTSQTRAAVKEIPIISPCAGLTAAREPLYETCRQPPDGTEYCADEPAPSAAESPPPPPPPPQQQQPQHHQAGLPTVSGELPASSSPPGVPPLTAPPHLLPGLLPGGPAMFPQQQAGFPFHNMYAMGMPGGGVNMMYPMAGYTVPGYPAPPETEASDRRRQGGGKKGAEKPLSYQSGGYPLTPRSATGQPLMMQPFAGHPYGAPYYPLPYGYYPGATYPGGEMMLAPLPAQLPPVAQQPEVAPPAAVATEESRTPLAEPYGRAEEPEAAAASPAAETDAAPAADAAVAAADTVASAAETAASSNATAAPETETPEVPASPTPGSDVTPAPETAPTTAAEPTTAAAETPAAARLSFWYDMNDKLDKLDKLVVGESTAVQLEPSGATPEPPEASPEPAEERTGDGRPTSAEPPAPTSYVATVTVSQRRVVQPPPEPEREAGALEEPGVGSASPAAETREKERAVSLGSQPGSGAASPQPEPAQEPEPEPAPAPAPPAPRSWASLFSKKTEGAAPTPPPPAAPKPAPPPPVPETDKELLALGAALSRFELCHKNVYLQPRGLTNKSNWCYINAVLQALASCTPFYHLMRALPHHVGVLPDRSRTPIIDAMVEFVREFSPLPELPRIPRRDRGQLRDIQAGPPFEPTYVYAMLSRVSSDAFRVAGRQEDAEEFLTCLLSGLQDEMAEVLKVYQKTRDDGRPPVNGAANGDARHDSGEDEGDPDDWQTIIGRNRGQVTRSAELQSTPISRVFSGQLRSSLHRQGAKATATVQSFFSLQLDIQPPQVSSVEQALEALVERDPVEGLTCPQSGRPVDAYQQAALELTPPTLILHLKRFLYDPETDGVQKLLKKVTFPVDLELKKELLSNVRTKMPAGLKRYRLFAIVYHSGKESTKGHYITDAYHPAYQQWVRYDDSTVSAVAEAAVLRPEPPLVPYILFYRRLDTVAAHNGK